MPGRQVWQQVEELEDEADAAPAYQRQLTLAEPGQVASLEQDSTTTGPVQPAHQVQQGGLAGAGRADDGDKASLRHLQADVIDGAHDFGLARVLFDDILDAEDRRRGLVEAGGIRRNFSSFQPGHAG